MPFSYSSRSRASHNADGSLPVYCSACNEFIANSFVKIPRALCALCERTQRGEQIPEDVIRGYQVGKGDRVDVSLLVVREEAKIAQKAKFTLRSLTGEVLEAVGFLKPEKEPAPISAKVSDSKRRKRLFNNVDLEKLPPSGLGSMQEMDKALKVDPKL